jgi:NADPH:quinone reductase
VVKATYRWICCCTIICASSATVMKSRSFVEKFAMTNRFRQRWLSAVATGQLAPLVDRVFPLAQAAEAHRYMEASGNLGKIVLTID